MTSLQSATPVFVTARYRNEAFVAGGSPVTVVLAWIVEGKSCQVLPPSLLH